MKPAEEPVSAFTIYENTNGNTTNGNKSKVNKNNKKSKKNANTSLDSKSFKKLSTDEMITQILSKERKKRKINQTLEAAASPVITKTATKTNEEPAKKKNNSGVRRAADDTACAAG